LPFEPSAKKVGVHQVPIVSNRQGTQHVLDNERLRVLQDRLTLRRVAVVAYRTRPLQPVDDLLAENLRNQSEPSVRDERLPSEATIPALSWPLCCRA
jgi:hypothetical protein